MRGSSLICKASLASQAIVIIATILTSPAFGGELDSILPSESRRFFNQGNQQLDREVELLEVKPELLKILLPQDLAHPEDLAHPDYTQQQNSSEPQSKSKIVIEGNI